jgi:hypothetical protein
MKKYYLMILCVCLSCFVICPSGFIFMTYGFNKIGILLIVLGSIIFYVVSFLDKESLL